jgi:hypothetical protein
MTLSSPSVSLACLAGSPLTELHHRVGIFSLSFQGLVAAGTPSRSQGTELHVPVEMNNEAEFFAAVIAAHIRG